MSTTGTDDPLLAYRVGQLEAKVDKGFDHVENRMDDQDAQMRRVLFAIIGGTTVVAAALFSVALTLVFSGPAGG